MESTWIKNCLYYMFCLFLYLKGGKILISLTNIVPLFLYNLQYQPLGITITCFKVITVHYQNSCRKYKRLTFNIFTKHLLNFFLKRIEVFPLSPKPSLTWFMYTCVYTIYSVQRIHVFKSKYVQVTSLWNVHSVFTRSACIVLCFVYFKKRIIDNLHIFLNYCCH